MNCQSVAPLRHFVPGVFFSPSANANGALSSFIWDKKDESVGGCCVVGGRETPWKGNRWNSLKSNKHGLKRLSLPFQHLQGTNSHCCLLEQNLRKPQKLIVAYLFARFSQELNAICVVWRPMGGEEGFKFGRQPKYRTSFFAAQISLLHPLFCTT